MVQFFLVTAIGIILPWHYSLSYLYHLDFTDHSSEQRNVTPLKIALTCIYFQVCNYCMLAINNSAIFDVGYNSFFWPSSFFSKRKRSWSHNISITKFLVYNTGLNIFVEWGRCLAWYDASLGRWRSLVRIRPVPLQTFYGLRTCHILFIYFFNV